MRARDLLIGIGVVASVCGATPPSRSLPRGATATSGLLGAGLPARQMVAIPAGTLRPLYGNAVKVGAFRLDRDPVTREEYLGWRQAARPIGNPRAPMTDVRWTDARDYCVARGGRLPTLAEWEYAAAASGTTDLLAAYASRSANPSTVDRGETNGLGVRGMHDLVWEWVADPNDRVAALYHAGIDHSHRHAKGQAHDLSCAGAALGAADPRDYPAFLRAAFRSGLTESTRLPTLGFRCAA